MLEMISFGFVVFFFLMFDNKKPFCQAIHFWQISMIVKLIMADFSFPFDHFNADMDIPAGFTTSLTRIPLKFYCQNVLVTSLLI